MDVCEDKRGTRRTDEVVSPINKPPFVDDDQPDGTSAAGMVVRSLEVDGGKSHGGC